MKTWLRTLAAAALAAPLLALPALAQDKPKELKIGIATFANPDGLAAVSGNAYRATIPSGEFVIKQPGVGGAGEIAPGTLEASTVDLSAEFTGLITTQKAYSASSKIITTADEMLAELLRIKG